MKQASNSNKHRKYSNFSLKMTPTLERRLTDNGKHSVKHQEAEEFGTARVPRNNNP
jgi:hypothetical protein